MKNKLILGAVIGVALLATGCSYQVNVQENKDDQQPAVNQNQAAEKSPDVVVETEKLPETTLSDKKVYNNGYIKSYKDGGYGDVSNYLELSDKTKIDLIGSCDARYTGINEQINSLVDKDIYVNLSTYKNPDPTYLNSVAVCVNGIAVNIPKGAKKYSGLIKSYTNGGYEDVTNYLEMTNGTKIDLIGTCDARLGGIKTQINSSVDKDTSVELSTYPSTEAIYKESTAKCVNGIVVNL